MYLIRKVRECSQKTQYAEFVIIMCGLRLETPRRLELAVALEKQVRKTLPRVEGSNGGACCKALESEQANSCQHCCQESDVRQEREAMID